MVSAGQAFLEMKLDGRMARGGNKSLGELASSIRLQQRRRQPRRFEVMNEMPGLADISRPEHVVRRSAGSVVEANGCRGIRLEKIGIPAMPGRNAAQPRRGHEREIVGRRGDPLQEGLPDGIGLFQGESLKRHMYVQSVARPDIDDLPPMGIEKTFSVEIKEPADQPVEGGVGGRLDRRRHAAEEGRQCVRAQRHAVTTPKLPPPPPLGAHNRSAFVPAFAIGTRPSALTISPSSTLAAAVPELFDYLRTPLPSPRPPTPTVPP